MSRRSPPRDNTLNLVLDDQAFQWLRELSAFIVMIDEALAQKTPPITVEDAERLIAQARGLLSHRKGHRVRAQIFRNHAARSARRCWLIATCSR
jgi:hypothetical protein